MPGTHPQLDPLGQAQPQHRHAEGTRPAGLVAHGHVRQVRPLRQPRPEEERRLDLRLDQGPDRPTPTARSSARTRRTSTSRGRSDERRSIADAVQYIANDMQALETERSIRVAGTAAHRRRSRRDVRRPVLPRAAPRGGDRRRARLAGDHRQGVGGGRHGVARVPEHDPAPQPGLHHRLPGPAERQGSRQLPVRDVLPRADPGRRLRQEAPTSRRSTSTTTATPSLGEVLTQDLDNSENVTIGMHSPSFDGHRLSTDAGDDHLQPPPRRRPLPLDVDRLGLTSGLGRRSRSPEPQPRRWRVPRLHAPAIGGGDADRRRWVTDRASGARICRIAVRAPDRRIGDSDSARATARRWRGRSRGR